MLCTPGSKELESTCVEFKRVSLLLSRCVNLGMYARRLRAGDDIIIGRYLPQPPPPPPQANETRVYDLEFENIKSN